ncbi:MAG: NAD(P)-dependent oxidoreductase [Acidiferrobacteraceae bacterium]|nr:NAD(P)-dependent oxidoreductase [Acidiferrobacteraceae bacterium]
MTDSFFVGCGYVGRQVALREVEDGGVVTALVRSKESADLLLKCQIDSVVQDLDTADETLAINVSGKILYWFVPPPNWASSDTRIARVLQSITGPNLPVRFILISTTGVYGDCGGNWINESQPLNPNTDRAIRRVDAEMVATKWSVESGVPTVILRVPGIYGPSKLPIERLKRREPVLAIEDSPWSNRIHVTDLARACIAASRVELDQSTIEPVICNVSDGNPSTMSEYFLAVAEAHDLPSPPIIRYEMAKHVLTSSILSYLNESKRIDNTRMREWLGVTPFFPNLEAGLDWERSKNSMKVIPK